MNLAEVRDRLASDRLGMSPKAMRNLSTLLFHDPALFALSGLEVDGASRYGNAKPTPGALALLLIAAMIDARPSEEWQSATMQHWHAQAWTQASNDDPRQPPPLCPVTGAKVFGRALAYILDRSLCASRVVRIEVSRAAPIWTLWHRMPQEAPRRSLFVACHARELAEGLDALPRAASVALPGSTLLELALLLARLSGRRTYLRDRPRG